jgi:hypothetical protein
MLRGGTWKETSRLVSRGFKSQNDGVWIFDPKIQKNLSLNLNEALFSSLKYFGSLTIYGSTDVKVK